ncbi:hypothetical protein GALL_355070 [mine drainage metagenome]|uniref:Uncharacterized protein n=1 Tax=mine drainage metagenome TaxID=410659 RepID=A0A1J5QGP4_9ZZZZ
MRRVNQRVRYTAQTMLLMHRAYTRARPRMRKKHTRQFVRPVRVSARLAKLPVKFRAMN